MKTSTIENYTPPSPSLFMTMTTPTPVSKIKSLTLKTIAVLKISHLNKIASRDALSHGLSIHRDIIIVWDEDQDTRVVEMLDQYFTDDTVKPLAVCENTGIISVLWKDEWTAMMAPVEYELNSGDCWSAIHFYGE